MPQLIVTFVLGVGIIVAGLFYGNPSLESSSQAENVLQPSSDEGGVKGFYNKKIKQILSVAPLETMGRAVDTSLSGVVESPEQEASAQPNPLALEKKNEVINTLEQKKEFLQLHKELMDIEIQYKSNVLDIISPYKDKPTVDTFAKWTTEQKNTLVDYSNLIKKRIDLVDREILYYAEKDTQLYLQTDFQAVVDSGLKAAKEAFETFRLSQDNSSKIYDKELKNIESYLGTSVSSPAQRSTTVSPTQSSVTSPRPSGSMPCSSNQGISICGSTSFDPNAYTIESMINSYGETMYKLNPPSGAKIPGLGYFKSEQEAIDSYKSYLTNNNLPQ